jgi:hypothetical protein
MAFTIRIAKYNRTVDVEFSTLPEEAQLHIIEYGLRQNLNDRVAGEADADIGMALINKRLASLGAGDFRSTGGRESDPVMAEAKRLASVAVKNAIRKAGKKVADYEDQLKGLIESFLDKHPEVLDVADANVKGRKSAPSVNLSDL